MFFDGSLNHTCERLEKPSPVTVTLAAFITVGILISYIPQHAKIIRKGSSEGLSPWWVLLGGLSSIAALGNIMTLPASRDDMRCCKSIGAGECVAALLGIVQIGMQFTCFMLIVMLFVTYASSTNPEHDVASISDTSSDTTLDDKHDARRAAVIVSFSTLAGALFTLIASVIFVSALPSYAQEWANFLGAVAGTLATIQYVPQIYYTYRLGDIKSLSLLTMTIQIPGAFLFALSLWLRVGWEGWSAWAVYIVTAILQSILFGLAVYYTFQQKSGDRKALQPHAGEACGAAVNEETSLLGNDR